MHLGFIGLGIMGSRMAANLQGAGYDLVVHNRSADKARELIGGGATWAATPAELASQVDMLFTMLAHPDAVAGSALGENGFLSHLPSSALWIDCSTTNPSFARRLAEQATAREVRFIDAPVAGSKEAAAKAQLAFFAGGSEDDLDDCRPELETMGNRIVHAGAVGMGTALKVVFNHQLAINMAAFAEGLVLGQSLGFSQEQLLDLLLGTPAIAPIAGNKRPKLEAEKYDTDFPLRWMQKDLHMASVAAYESGVALPLGNSAKELYRLAMRSGLGDMDFSAIYQFLLEEWDVE